MKEELTTAQKNAIEIIVNSLGVNLPIAKDSYKKRVRESTESVVRYATSLLYEGYSTSETAERVTMSFDYYAYPMYFDFVTILLNEIKKNKQ